MQALSRQWLAGFVVTAWAALSSACGEKVDDGVTFEDDVRPIFDQRCTMCHQPGAKYGPGTGSGPDILDPYAQEDGLLVARNNWKSPPHPEFLERVVVPGEPDQSFLMQKITPGALPDAAGSPMPQQVAPLTDIELGKVEAWIRNGALPNEEWTGTKPESTNPEERGIDGLFNGVCTGCPGKCDLCHYAGTPNPPDLSDPFGPNGIVNVTSFYRTDMLRVAPGDPDASLLVQRIRAGMPPEGQAEGWVALPGSEYGAPMPKVFPALSEAEVDTVREWIVEGARP